MELKRLYLIFILKFILIQLLFSQSYLGEIDSLERKLGRNYKQATIGQLCQLSELYIKRGKYEKADEIIKLAIDRAKNAEDNQDIGRVFKAEGKLLFELKKYDQAIQKFIKSEPAFLKEQNWKDLEETYKLIHFTHELKGEYKKALFWAKKAQTISDKGNGKLHDNNCSIGYLYQLLEKYDSAEYYFKRCKEHRLKYNKYPQVLDAIGNLQYLYQITKQYDKEFKEITEKEKLCVEKKDCFNHAEVVRTKASFLHFLNDTGSISVFYEAIKLATDSRNNNVLARSFLGIGDIYFNQKHFDKALSYYVQSSEISIEHKLLRSYAYSEQSICDCFVELGNYKKALHHIKLAIEINNQSGYEHQQPYIYYSYAKLLLCLNENRKAYEMINSGLLVCRKTKNIHKEINLLCFKTTVLTNLNEMDKAKLLLDSIMPLIDSLNVQKYKVPYFEAHYYWLMANEKYKEAVNYLQQLREQEKLMASEELETKAEKLAALYKIDQYKTENLILRNESAQQIEIIKQQKLLMLAFLIIFILTAVLIINLYLTKQKKERVARTLQRQRDEIKKLNDSKDLFFSIIAHDLRNPVGNIINFSNFLNSNLKSGNTEQIQKAAGYIDSQSKATLNVLDNLLQWANSQRNVVAVKKDFYLLSEIIQNVQTFFNGRLVEKEITFNIEIEPDTMVYADRNMMEVVFRNLISNAIKFTPKNGLIKVKSKTNETVLRVEIKDNGIGIESARLQEIFNPYIYKSTKGTDMEKGTGLGLKICKDFIERNGGRVGVVSEVARGSCFYVELPMRNEGAALA